MYMSYVLKVFVGYAVGRVRAARTVARIRPGLVHVGEACAIILTTIGGQAWWLLRHRQTIAEVFNRSEERRVGKEGKSLWAHYACETKIQGLATLFGGRTAIPSTTYRLSINSSTVTPA